jgi:NTP pyrophosphatase (non-canonical NTP hydrolase)
MNSNAPLTFAELQAQVKEWADRNFDDRFPYRPLLGATEELGELTEAAEALLFMKLTSRMGRLAHAQLKLEQGIRGDAYTHLAEAQDAVGDILVYLADYCNCSGFSMQTIIESVWGRVKQRNWKKDPEKGGGFDTPKGE